MNDGGRGSSNPTKEVRKRLSKAAIGNKRALGAVSVETRAKLSKAAIGNKRALGAVRSVETRAKLSKAAIGNKRALGVRSVETRRRMSLAQKGLRLGIPLSEETKRKISASTQGAKNHNFGKKHPGLNAGKKNPMFGKKCPWVAERNRKLKGALNPMSRQSKCLRQQLQRAS